MRERPQDQSPSDGANVRKVHETVSTKVTGEGYVLYLDGRAAQTPQKNTVLIPTAAMAACVRAEWQCQRHRIDIQTMPISRRLMAVIDHRPEDVSRWQKTVTQVMDTDLLCYRAASPDGLAARQAALWEPFLTWAEETLGLALEVTTGLAVPRQPADTGVTLDHLLWRLAPYEAFCLAGYVELLGSVILGLALLKGRVTESDAFEASALEELFQAQRWGADACAARRRAEIQLTLGDTCRFQRLYAAPNHLAGVTGV